MAPGSFSGRDRELSILQQWWDDADRYNLVVHGSIGQGKTALAREFIRRLGPRGGEAVWYDQGQLASAGEVLTAQLLVLDNVEQREQSDVGELLGRRAAQGRKTLVTTRTWSRDWNAERLRLRGLSTKPTETITDGLSVSAELIVTLLRRKDLQFSPAPADLDRLEKLARAVDGVPLEIERVVQFVGMLAFDELLSVVRHERFSLLSDLYKALKRSYEALPQPLQRAATRLPILGPQFRLDDAAAVLARPRLECIQVLQALDDAAWVETSPGSDVISIRSSYRLFGLEQARVGNSVAGSLVEECLRSAAGGDDPQHAMVVLESIAPRILRSNDSADIRLFRTAYAIMKWRTEGASAALASLPTEGPESEMRAAFEAAAALEGSDNSSRSWELRERLLSSLVHLVSSQFGETTRIDKTITAKTSLAILCSGRTPLHELTAAAVRPLLPGAVIAEVYRDLLDPDQTALVVTQTFDFAFLRGASLEGIVRSDLLRRALRALVLRHQNSPGEVCSPEEVIEAMWPDEIVDYDAANNRLYVSISRMRSAGLGDDLETVTGEGYRLSPGLLLKVIPG